MYRNPRASWHPQASDYDYVVYFYQSGHFDEYLQRQKDLFAGLNYGSPPMYDFSSDLHGKGAWLKQQTVEDVIRNGYFSVPKSELETAIISDRKHTAWLGLDDVVGQIRHRYEVYKRNIYAGSTRNETVWRNCESYIDP